MVSDHNENNEYFDFPDTHYGYLVCTFCRGYYELQEGESPDDFDRCECGNALEYHSTVQFNSQIHGPRLDGSGTVPGSYSENTNINYEDELNAQHNQIPDNRQIINQLTHQDSAAEDMISNIQQDTRELWDIVDQYQPTAEEDNQTTHSQDVIEMNRLMMLVDERKALGENRDSKLKSIIGRTEPISFLSAIVVMLIIVFILVLANELFNII